MRQGDRLTCDHGMVFVITATMRVAGVALVLALVSAMAGAQAKPAMQHDMSKMTMDTGMKHDMAAMRGFATTSGWKEFDAFHTLMMSMSTPAQAGDLKPARDKAAELVAVATMWAASKGPITCDNTQARRFIPGVVRLAKALAKMVGDQGSDDHLKSALQATHMEFEKVAVPCLKPAAKDSSLDRFKMESFGGGVRGRARVPAVRKP